MNFLNNQALFQEKNLTGSGWVDSENGEKLAVKNPYNQEIIGYIPVLSQSQLEESIKESEIAQKKWANKTAEERALLLMQWADLIDQNKQDLAKIIAMEGGKPITEAIGEITYANSFIRWFAEEGKRVYGNIIPSKSSALRYLVLKQPIGVCAAITPWNFPAAMITRKVAPALASGCSMIVKPAEETPFTALALACFALEAGIPLGVLQVVTGHPKEIGLIFSENDKVRKISFTGSTQVGRLLMAQSAKTVTKVSMELGGNAPFIVFEDADLDKAAKGLIASKFRNAGQTCVCANRIFVHEKVEEAFLQKLLPLIEALKMGNPMEESTQIGPLINEKGKAKVMNLVNDAINKGAKVHLGQEVLENDLFYPPTVLTQINHNMEIAQAEIFGPVVAIQTFSSEEEALQKANDTIYGLAAYIYTENGARAWRVVEGLEYGMVGHNTGLISNEVAPFGGVKQSGIGREGSMYGIEEYIETKYWCSAIS